MSTPAETALPEAPPTTGATPATTSRRAGGRAVAVVLSLLTVTACLFGLGAGQLVAGPLSDRFRRRPLLIGVLDYVVAVGGRDAVPLPQH